MRADIDRIIVRINGIIPAFIWSPFVFGLWQKIITGIERARGLGLILVGAASSRDKSENNSILISRLEAAPTSDKAQVVDAIGLQLVRTES